MAQNDKQILIQVVDLIRQGDNPAAIQLLAKLLRNNPKHEQGWYLMGVAMDDPEKKVFAFEKVLEINPESDRAWQQMEKLGYDRPPLIPTPIVVDPPPPPSPPVIESPLIETPWEASADLEDIDDLEIPSWARDISSVSLDHFGGEEIDQKLESAAAFTVDPTEIEAEEEEPKEKQKRGLFRGRKDISEEAAESEFSTEEKSEKKSKRKSRKEKRAEKQAEKQAEQPAAADQKEKSLQEELLGDKPPKKMRRRRRRPRKGLVVFLLFFVICLGLGGGAYYYQESLIALVTQYAPTVISLLTQEPTMTPDYTPTQTFTPAIPPTLPPTWTPGAANVGAVDIPTTPEPGVTPTITPTLLPLAASVIEDMDRIENQMLAIRALRKPGAIEREMLSKPRFQSYMAGKVNEETDWEAEEKQKIVQRALGFVIGDYNQALVLINDRSDYFGGAFEVEGNRIVLAGTGFYDLEKYAYAYEYGLAILNDNYDIFEEFCQGGFDACLAESALFTGDAALTQKLWLQTYQGQFKPDNYFNLTDPAPYFGGSGVAFFNARRNFALTYGHAFVAHLYDNNGWQTINYTYRFPPETSEQVIHPEKYDIREKRVLLYDPNLVTSLGEGWELIEQEILGEWMTYLLLTAPDYQAAVRSEAEAAAAAAGWGGDTYQVLFNQESGKTMLAVHWNWDSADDLTEFIDSFSASQAGRFQNSVFSGPGEGTCWNMGEQYSCLYSAGRDVLWIYSDDLTALENAKNTFTQFP
jgi:hypothetical protein